jgi:subtilase family serine protease
MPSLSSKLSRVGAAAALLAGLLLTGPVPVAAAGIVFPAVGVKPHVVPATPDANEHFACQDRHLNDPSGTPSCYGPQSIYAAYGFDKLLSQGITGKGRTIVIVDAFQNPQIKKDLAAFDAAFGLKAPPALNIIAPFGLTPFDPNNDNQVGWSSEISLDVEWAHAIAPDATIDLVLSRDDQDANINKAVKYAVDHNLGDVISQSFGGAENCAAASDVKALHQTYQKATARGMTLIASSGDDGAAQLTCDFTAFQRVASWPANDPFVTSVGATNLQADLKTGAYVSERAWADEFSGCAPARQFGCSGGGFSNVYDRPDYQASTAGTKHGHRGVPDVSYNGGVDGGVLAYWGLGGGFFIFGGTSAGAPQWAGLVAMADQLARGRLGQIDPDLYSFAASPRFGGTAFHDISSGNNSFQNVDGSTIAGYKAARGWDAVTGLGTPKANVLVPLLASGH